MKLINNRLAGTYLLYISVLILLGIQMLSGAAYYVALNGSDDNDGSVNAPWKTIMYSIQNSGPGDTILVRGGNYPEQDEIWIQNSLSQGGAPRKWKTIKAFPGEIAKISQRILVDADYVRIEGFYLSDGNAIIVWEEDSPTSHVQILNNHFSGRYNVYAGAIDFKGSFGLIQGNRLELEPTTTNDHGIYVMSGSHNIVRNNYISGTMGYGIHVYDENKYQYLGQYNPKIKNIIIENNLVKASHARSGIIVSAGESNSLAIEIDSVLIRNNVVIKNAQNAIVVNGYGKIRNANIYNNVFYENSKGILVDGVDVDSIAIINNIFAKNGKNISIENVSHFVISHNLYWRPESVGSGLSDDYAVLGDPLFVSPDKENFHLRKRSPAIDKGIFVGLPFEGKGPDIGAFEYSGALATELMFFNAQQKNNQVVLTWQAALEYYFAGFEVERSLDNVNFIKVGYIPPGQSAPQQYRFVDNTVKNSLYYYRLKLLLANGDTRYSSVIKIKISKVSDFNLEQNYPNPFNSRTKIKFSIGHSAWVDLKIYAPSGQSVKTLMKGHQASGQKAVFWDGTDDKDNNVASGLYLYALRVGNFTKTKKMLLLR